MGGSLLNIELPRIAIEDSPNFVAFGPDGGWVALYNNDKVHHQAIYWSGLSVGLTQLLKSRCKRNLPRVSMLAFDDDSSVICYCNGSYKTYDAGNIYEEDLFP